jgi:UPF0755 protein
MRRHKYSDTDPLWDPETRRLDPVEFRRRLRGWLAVLLSLAILLGGAGFVAAKGYEAYTTFKTEKDFPGPAGADTQIVIPKNSTALQVGKILVDAKVVKDAKKFQDIATTRPDLWGKVQAGKYKIATGIPSLLALQQLLEPARADRVWVQLREGQRLDPLLVAALSKGTKLPVADISAYLTKTNPADIGLPTWAGTKAGDAAFEGLLFPDTYEVVDGVTPASMVKTIVAQFKAVTDNLDFYNAAQKLDFGPKYATASADQKAYMALTVASIIEREVSRAEDRPRVARVIYNRLAKGVPLQLDSTTSYAVKKTDSIWTSDADRASSSPYNTYLAVGLPPTPISAPGEAALSAAINPEPGDWLYFQPIDLSTGETVFSADLATHDQAAAQLKTWCAASAENKKLCP